MYPNMISICNQFLKIMNELLYFFIRSLQKPEFIINLEHISVQTSHIPGAQQPHVISGYYIVLIF